MNQDNRVTTRITRREQVATDVVLLELRSPGGGPLPEWEPGAHIDVELGAGLRRSYSLCGDYTDSTTWRIAVKRENRGRGGSNLVHERLHEGTAVVTTLPRNNFALEPQQRHILIAGGIGITPLIPMVQRLAAGGADWDLWFGGRNIESMAFADQLAQKYPQAVHLVPEDINGFLPLDEVLGQPPGQTVVHCCGPSAMITAVAERCARHAEYDLHVELFGAPVASGDPAESGAFDVHLRQSGIQIAIPADKSILEVLRENDFDVDSSCEEGTCGTCETKVLSGRVDHRDFVLDGDERTACSSMMICVSRSLSASLTLDL